MDVNSRVDILKSNFTLLVLHINGEAHGLLIPRNYTKEDFLRYLTGNDPFSRIGQSGEINFPCYIRWNTNGKVDNSVTIFTDTWDALRTLPLRDLNNLYYMIYDEDFPCFKSLPSLAQTLRGNTIGRLIVGDEKTRRIIAMSNREFIYDALNGVGEYKERPTKRRAIGYGLTDKINTDRNRYGRSTRYTPYGTRPIRASPIRIDKKVYNLTNLDKAGKQNIDPYKDIGLTLIKIFSKTDEYYFLFPYIYEKIDLINFFINRALKPGIDLNYLAFVIYFKHLKRITPASMGLGEGQIRVEVNNWSAFKADGDYKYNWQIVTGGEDLGYDFSELGLALIKGCDYDKSKILLQSNAIVLKEIGFNERTNIFNFMNGLSY